DLSFQVTTSREPTNEPFFFKVVASKPVLVFIGPSDAIPPATYQTSFWVPSLDGGLLGSTFGLIAPSASYAYPQKENAPGPNSLIVVGGPQDAQVNWFASNGAGGNQLVKARSVWRLSGYAPGAFVGVFAPADRGIMLMSSGYLSHHGAQAVSAYGAPVGTTLFMAPTQTTSAAIIGHEASAVTVLNVEDPAKFYPREAPYALEAGCQNAWIPPGPTWITHDSYVWQVRSSGMVSAIYGDRGLYAVGGLEARDFHVLLRSAATLYTVEAKGFVMPFYPQTRVDIERYNETLGRYTAVVQRVVGPESYLATKPGTTDPVMIGDEKDPGCYRIRSSKPVLVYTFAEESTSDGANTFPFSTFVGGRVRPPLHAFGDVEFYGPLVSWTTKLLQETVKPGDQVVATFEVQNLGRSADGRALADSVSIVTRTQKGAPAWTTRLSTAFEANVPGGETRFVTVAVDVPKDAKTDETLDLELVAVSETNPAIRDSALLQITVQTRYEIELSFRANSRATLQSVIDPGTTREFLVRVKNVGSGPDGVSFTMLRANPFGFEADVCVERDDGTCESFLDPQGLARLGVDGRPVSLQLGVNEERDVVLTVKAPKTSEPAQHNFVVEGTSTSDSASRKQLTLVALTNARTALRILAVNDTFDVAPGVDATLPIEVINEGVETVVDVRLRAADLPGWNLTLDPVSFELRSPGVVDPRDDRPLDRRIVNLTVRAGPGAAVGFLMPIEVVAASGTRLGDAEAPETKAFVTATVVNNFTLLVPELLERSVLPGAEVGYDLELLSLANGNFTVAPVATRLPPGWELSSVDPPVSSLVPGGRATVHLVLKTRANEAASLYQGDFGFVLEDEGGRRGVVTAPFALRVKRHVDYVAVPDGAFVVPPGGVTRASFAVTNTGNVNATLEMSVDAPAGWIGALVDNRQSLLELAPGEAKAVDVRVEAAEDPAGNEAEFGLVGNIPLEREKSTPFRVTVLRDDLVVTKVESLTTRLRTGEPAVFQVTLVNNGTIPRTNVEVALVVDGHIARNVTIRSIPPGEARVVQIPWNVVPADSLAVVVDPENVYREEDEENNRVVFDLAGAQRVNLPAAGVGLVAAAAAAAAAARAKDEGCRSKDEGKGTRGRGPKGMSRSPFDRSSALPQPEDPSSLASPIGPSSLPSPLGPSSFPVIPRPSSVIRSPSDKGAR
ncbi:MAG TPA: CARDB domain-containing protein, partial [Candidatus Thermoplasmatota archaeon]|nr:CARDB domain-containing protein [Candidatus Thermoplasmatota archaeon]